MPVEELYLLAINSSPDIKSSVCARMGITKQVSNEAHSLSYTKEAVSYHLHNLFSSIPKSRDAMCGKETRWNPTN